MTSATQTANEISAGASGLERLLKIGLGAYQSIANLKLEKQMNQQALQQTQSAPAAPAAPAPVLDQKTLIIAGGAVLGAVVLVLLLKK